MVKKLVIIGILVFTSIACSTEWYEDLNIVVINKSGKDITITKFGEGTVFLKNEDEIPLSYTDLIHSSSNDAIYMLQWFIDTKIGTLYISEGDNKQRANSISIANSLNGLQQIGSFFNQRGTIKITIKSGGIASITQDYV